MIAVLALLALASSPTKVYTAMSTSDLDDLSKVLRKRVAYVTVKTKKTADNPMSAEPANGWGSPIEEDLLVLLAHVVKDAEAITVTGPKGKMTAKMVLLDLSRRVALLRTERPVSTIGLEVVTPAPKSDRKSDMNIFALVSTDEHAGVVHGVMTHTGALAEYEGHPRVDLRLAFGMPVFDERARFVGYSRVVAWDVDKNMIVPHEMIVSARTSTGAASQRGAVEKTPERPWWGR